MHKNLVKFGLVVFNICKWTDRHLLITILHTPPAGEESIYKDLVLTEDND